MLEHYWRNLVWLLVRFLNKQRTVKIGINKVINERGVVEGIRSLAYKKELRRDELPR